MASVPKHLLDEIQRYDPFIRLRWGRQRKKWCIERKIERGKWVPPERFIEHEWDDYEAAREGYVILFDCHTNELDSRIPYTLWWSDVKRLGGSEQFYQDWCEEDERKGEKRRKDFLDEIKHRTKEVWRHLNTPKTGWKPYWGSGRGPMLDWS